jgi:hypothetical protein
VANQNQKDNKWETGLGHVELANSQLVSKKRCATALCRKWRKRLRATLMKVRIHMFEDLFDAVVDTVEDAIDVGTAVVTFGEYGEFSKRKVAKLLAAGMSAYAIASVFDVGVDVVEEIADEFD